MRLFVVICFLTIQGEIIAQEHTPSIDCINSWQISSIPKDSFVLWNYGNDTTSWALFERKGDVYAMNLYQPDAKQYFPANRIPDAVAEKLWKDEQIQTRQSKSIMPVNDGFLVGINRGEWGGHIVWYSIDGKEKYQVSNDKVYEFIRKDGIIYGIEGTNHTYTSKGNLIRLTQKNGKWVSERILELPYGPFGICVNEKNNFVIGTLRNIIEVDSNGVCKVLYDDPVWIQYDIYLYPRSLVIKDNTIYVGMRKGVLKYDLKSGIKAWLMKN